MKYFLILALCIQNAYVMHAATRERVTVLEESPHNVLHYPIPLVEINTVEQPKTCFNRNANKFICGAKIIGFSLFFGSLGFFTWLAFGPPPKAFTTTSIIANDCNAIGCPDGFEVYGACTPPFDEYSAIESQLRALCPNSASLRTMDEYQKTGYSSPSCTPIDTLLKAINQTCSSAHEPSSKEHHLKKLISQTYNKKSKIKLINQRSRHET